MSEAGLSGVNWVNLGQVGLRGLIGIQWNPVGIDWAKLDWFKFSRVELGEKG